MLKNLNTYLLVAIAILVCDFIFFELSDNWMVFDVFIRMSLWFGTFVFLLTGLIIVLLHKRLWIPNLILLVCSFCLVIALYYGKNWFNEKDLLLRASYDGDINGMDIELFEDNTYKIHDGSLMGGDVSTGTYRISNDTLLFDSTYPLGEDRPFFTNRLLIKDSTLTIITTDSSNISSNPTFRITPMRSSH